MEILKTQRTIRIHHAVIVDGIKYFRNEELLYNTNGVLVFQEHTWVVGDEDGNGPYVEPGSKLDHFKKYTPSELENEFNKNFKTE